MNTNPSRKPRRKGIAPRARKREPKQEHSKAGIVYTPELADMICGLIADGMSLREICRREDVPGKRQVLRWLAKHKEFADLMAEARDMQVDGFVDELVQIADRTDLGPKERRVMIYARERAAAMMKPRKYGNFAKLEHTGADGGPIVVKASTEDEKL